LRKSTSVTETSTVANDNSTEELDEDDDEDDADWTDILGSKSTRAKAEPTSKTKRITLTAIRYGRLSFTITARDNMPYMLGRAANQNVFLSQDGRVGNEHCYIFYRDGFWHVKDNHSANGTFVNSRDIGEDGEHVLGDSDTLKLGHHPDSMEFRITIQG
jgi:pSer/pThr/pTyr-binding forkhead associated (FHA) protein